MPLRGGERNSLPCPPRNSLSRGAPEYGNGASAEGRLRWPICWILHPKVIPVRGAPGGHLRISRVFKMFLHFRFLLLWLLSPPTFALYRHYRRVLYHICVCPYSAFFCLCPSGNWIMFDNTLFAMPPLPATTATLFLRRCCCSAARRRIDRSSKRPPTFNVSYWF